MIEPTRELPAGSTAPSRRRRIGVVPALILAVASGAGCGREFFRNWADQDVSEAVFEKSRDPRWRLDTFSHEPPALSRFANPYDPDRPPAPPDDYAAEALSPMPQWPHHRLLTPAEGTGYLEMLEAWRSRPGAPAAAPPPLVESPPAPPPPPPPPEGSRAPFSPSAAPEPGRNPGTATEGTAPKTSGTDDDRNRYLVTLTPIPRKGADPRADLGGHRNPADRPILGPRRFSAQVQALRRDPAVRVAAFQATELPPPAPQPGDEAAPPASSTGLDPRPTNRNLSRPVDVRPDQSPREYREAEAETSELASILVPGALTFDEAEAAGLPKDSRPYVVTPDQAITLALINSRPYQFRLENLYLASLAVTLQRFAFQPQFYAGLSPLTGVANSGLPQPIYSNSFLYRTRAAPGGQASILNLGEVAGVGKVFFNGVRLLTGFANQVVFNFTGRNVRQPSIQSALPLTLALPLLRGGGRAVTLEALTQAERNLLYEIRSFARFRQEFIPYVLLDVQAIDNPGTSDPAVGYLNVLQQLQLVEIDRRNVAKFERVLEVYSELARGAGSDLTQLQVDQIDQSRQLARQTLINDTILYRNLLDQYKIQLGLPPDTPLVLDRGLTAKFRDVFDRIDKWSLRTNRRLEELPGFLRDLPQLVDIAIDGRTVKAIIDENNQESVEKLNEYVMAAERVALENRLDLMNARAQLYDAWRQLAVTSNALKGFFNISLTNQIFTPPTTTNPFGFFDQSKQFSLVLNTELPLVRVAERNNYLAAQINFNRQQRLLMLTEDSVKFAVRQEVRSLIQQAQTYEIQQRTFLVTLRLVDQTQEQLIAPPAGAGGAGSGQGAAQTINLVNFQQRIPQAQNTLVQTWVNYETLRLALYRDLGLMPYDEWTAYHELFPASSTRPPAAPIARPRPATATTPRPAQVSRR